MEPSTATPLPVLVQAAGRTFVWTLEEGLDPEVVMTVDRFVWRKAHSLRRIAAQAGLSVDDLAQEGRMGALRAAQRFVPNDNNNFLSFACHHIVERMLTALGSREVYLPVRHRKALRVAGTLPSVCSIDTFGADGRAFRAEAGQDEAEAGEQRALVLAALDQIPERDRVVLEGLFGIGMEPQTLAEVGEALGVTKQRVMQIKARAMLRLRLVIGAKGIQ